MTQTRRAALAGIVFFAFTAPLGIAAHLISELAGLGWHDDADVAFSARHGYLAGLAIVSIVSLLVALRTLPRSKRRTQVAELIESLPFGGRGVAFTAVSFLAQFVFFAITQIGEGCPLCGGDVVTGVFAAAIAALLGAIAVSFGKRRFLEFVLTLVAVFVRALRETRLAAALVRRRFARTTAKRRTAFSFRYRPPPRAAASLTA